MALKTKAWAYNPEATWEYNMMQFVRWDSEDAKDDVVYFIRTYAKYIIREDPELLVDCENI